MSEGIERRKLFRAKDRLMDCIGMEPFADELHRSPHQYDNNHLRRLGKDRAADNDAGFEFFYAHFCEWRGGIKYLNFGILVF